MRPIGCPLCGCERSVRSWRGSTRFAEQLFEYVRCQECGSAYCSPMPDSKTLALMYGPDYGGRGPKDGDVEGVCDRDWVASWLRKRAPLDGPFVDYGCGHGELLSVGRAAGCEVAGVEFNAEVARRVERLTGERVFAVGERELAPLDGRVAVLHLGDVIEHLTEPHAALTVILRLLRPDGVLLAQGPLEAQANLFNGFLRAKRALSKDTPADVPPYHVLLATAAGQRALFDRLRLRTLEFALREVDWPAPSRLSPAMLREPRTASLYFARRASRAVSALAPEGLGNRYCYAGVHAARA